MKPKLDPLQYANREGISIDHYQIKLIDRILTTLENNSKDKALAVLATLIDRKQSFPKECPQHGIESFLANRLRPAIICLVINYFQNRRMIVKWQNAMSHLWKES